MVEVGKLIEKEVNAAIQPWVKTGTREKVSYFRHDAAGVCVASVIPWDIASATQNPTWKWTVHGKGETIQGETDLITEAIEAADAALRARGLILFSNED